MLGVAPLATAIACSSALAAPRITPLTPAPADALSRALVRGDVSQTRYALERARALFSPSAVSARYGDIARANPRSATFVLRDLAARLDRLTATDQAAGSRLLARPSDEARDPEGSGWSAPEQDERSFCGTRFCIHWVVSTRHRPDPTDSDGDNTPNWIETTATILDTVLTRQVDRLGFPRPKSDRSSTGTDPSTNRDGRLDVYLADIGRFGLYGYCATDDPNAVNPNYFFYDVSAYCVVDNDFSRTQFVYGATGQAANRVTLAHEVHHAEQFALDWQEDIWAMEGGATMMERVVYPRIRDNYQYLRTSPITQPGIPLDWGAPTAGNLYGSWIFFEYLAQRFGGAKIVRDLWRRLDGRAGRPDDYSTQGLRRILRSRNRELPGVFANFANANRLPRKSYKIGKTLPRLVSPTRAHYRVGRRTPARAGALRLRHLSARWVSFRRRPGTPRRAKLLFRLDLPERWRGSAAKAVVVKRSGRRVTHTFSLNRAGDDRMRLSFGRRVRRVALLLVNASTRFRCWEGPDYSCRGRPLDDRRPFRFTVSLD
jgi:hypothetical protein